MPATACNFFTQIKIMVALIVGVPSEDDNLALTILFADLSVANSCGKGGQNERRVLTSTDARVARVPALLYWR